ncbi:type VII secretion protein EssB [Arthrobacter bambusae]|uniref:Type VII secretion protein EssB n=1 Tax=Arthrobacter bambusae TaxID=1338426 RepID=A0AAW8DDM9_9MICC|nr:type VII secretion protein EssB [Arthrobacter bambusae]MDP9903279.1 type VII secretion protein EssB [Arthrobacter bambusae]MDQ0128727.1 type VII secretion protein EssB [Arthrobacter bambusae]MDQ0180068.1 type VII secretion protein EssB [Arthrobacter bambusae]
MASTQVNAASAGIVREYVDIDAEVPDDCELAVVYPIPAYAQSLAAIAGQSKTRLDRLRLAHRLSAVAPLAGKFRVPFLHPENIEIRGERVEVVHFGLAGILAPMQFDNLHFLKCYKAVVLSVFHPRLPFEKLVDGSVIFKDDFSQRIAMCGTVAEVVSLIDEELAVEVARAGRNLASVPKLRYRLLRILSAVAAAAALVLGWFTYSAYARTQPTQAAVIAAQSDFLTNNYAQSLADLQGYDPGSLPKSARYVLAVSSVNLSELTAVQKQAVLNSISTKTDDNTLNYWIFLARGDLDQALNLAQNLGDDQLTLLAYTDLYKATKLNTTMDGASKQKLLEEYSKHIQDLSKSLGVNNGTAQQ